MEAEAIIEEATETTAETNPNAQIERRETVAEMVRAHKLAQETLVRVLDMIETAMPSLGRFGLDLKHVERYRNFKDDETMNHLQAVLRRGVWRELVKRLDVERMMSVQAAEEMNRKLWDDHPRLNDFPDVTEEAIYGWTDQLTRKAPDMIRDAIREVFEFLRPCRSEYKTNSEYEVGRKCIKEWWVDPSGCNGFRIYYQREAEVKALDNVFHMLDGRGLSKAPGDLLTALKEAMRARITHCETEYFRAKWYRKGSLHLEFKRLDLLAKLNEIGGGRTLKHDNQARRQS